MHDDEIIGLNCLNGELTGFDYFTLALKLLNCQNDLQLNFKLN